MHSKTAQQLSEGKGVITRNQAKAFNYARIYGAGQFERTLKSLAALER